MPKNTKTQHYFLDEAGDTTFFGKGKIPNIGTNGVSKSFSLGIAKISDDMNTEREKIRELAKMIENDPYFAEVPSIQKKIKNGGFFFHATDDVPEVRKIFFEHLMKKETRVTFDAIVGRKVLERFVRKHNRKENEFYADLLSHLVKKRLQKKSKVVFHISKRGSSTKGHVLDTAFKKAKERFLNYNPDKEVSSSVVFEVQDPRTDPLLSIPDYFLWCTQRVFERGETRYYHFLQEKIRLVIDLYDLSKYGKFENYYNKKNPLTERNIIQIIDHEGMTNPPTP